MEIRSVTLFCDPHFDVPKTAAFFAAARDGFSYPVQSTRLATLPFPDWWQPPQTSPPAAQAAQFAARCREAGTDAISLGPVLLRHDATWLESIPALIPAAEMLFTSVEIADTQGRIDMARCRHVATIMQKVSTLMDNGFGNLFMTALANCPPGSPFFPVAYHGGGAPTFAIAVEAADLALTAIQNSQTLEAARHNLVTAIEQAAAALATTAAALAKAHNIAFSGIDFSLAPYPTNEKSLAGALEALGLPALGAPGSFFAAAFVTEAIDRARFHRCGFSGLMLPVLEDAVLAQRAGQVTVNDLLGYAAVCGVGLDTIPLPGDISEETLAGILLDTAALATRLNKPLTARLMPIPGLVAGDAVQFDFPYFADGRVMGVAGAGISGLLRQGEQLIINTYHHKEQQ